MSEFSLSGFSVVIGGLRVPLWAWPVVQLGVTSGGLIVPLLLSADGSPVPASGGATSANQATQITAEQAIQALLAPPLSVNIGGTSASGNITTTSSNLSVVGATTITAGKLSIEFLLSTDFQGTINGATIDNTGTLAVGSMRFDAPPWKPLASMSYTITAGSAILTTQA